MIKNMFLPFIQKALNAYINLDPESTARLQPLCGKVATIEFLPFHFNYQCVFTDSEIHVQAEECLVSDVKIGGTPLQMLGMMMADDKRQFFAEDIRIEGDAELGQRIVELFDQLDIDWEEYMAKVVGDIPAHQVGRLSRGVFGWMQQIRETLTQDMAEFIHEEAAWVPTHEVVEEFFQEVDTLRMDVDRLEARVKAWVEKEMTL